MTLSLHCSQNPLQFPFEGHQPSRMAWLKAICQLINQSCISRSQQVPSDVVPVITDNIKRERKFLDVFTHRELSIVAVLPIATQLMWFTDESVWECFYVGHTKRKFCRRLAEHKNVIMMLKVGHANVVSYSNLKPWYVICYLFIFFCQYDASWICDVL